MYLKKIAMSLLVASSACAAIASDADIEALQKALKEKYPATKVSEVHRSPIQGLYEVVLGRNIVYTDKEGKYFVVGHIYDMAQQIDLTAERLAELKKVDWAQLPLQDAIKIVKGNGERKIAVFSDPDCPFCAKLEKETFAKLDNATIYVFLYPLEGLHPNAPTIAKKIWCSPDKAKAYLEYMINKTEPKAQENCDNPIDKNVKFGENLGIEGTPTLILENGRTIGGWVPLDRLEKELADAKGSKQ